MKLKEIIAGTAVVGLSLLAVAGCSSDYKSSSTTTTPKDAVCADKTQLQNSVKALTNADTLTGGKQEIQSGVDKVKKNLDTLRTSVKADLKPKVDDVKKALTQLQNALGDFSEGSITENLSKAGTAISKVGTTAGDLFSALDAQCPSS